MKMVYNAVQFSHLVAATPITLHKEQWVKGSHCSGLGSSPCHIVWGLWWTKWREGTCRRKTCVQLMSSLSMNVPGLAWCVAGTGLRQAMCWHSCVMRCAGSRGCAIGISSSPRILKGSPYTSSATDACKSTLKMFGHLEGRREVPLSNVNLLSVCGGSVPLVR
jgi:hypothetical protein